MATVAGFVHGVMAAEFDHLAVKLSVGMAGAIVMIMAAFLATPPWGWPAWLAAAGISGLWVVEALSLLGPALFGCFVGQERRRAPA